MNSLCSISGHGFRKNNAVIAAPIAYRYYKFEILATVSDIYQQFDDFFIGYNSVRLDYTGATVTAVNDTLNSPVEGVAQAIDNNITTKWICAVAPHPALVLDLQTAKLSNCFTTVTGNDSPARDPKSVVLYGSNNNTTWITLSTQPNYPTPSNRDYQLAWITFTT